MLLCRSRRDDIEDEDDQESFFRVMKDVPLEAYPDDDEEIDYDSDGNPIAPPRSKVCFAVKTVLDQISVSGKIQGSSTI